MRRTKMGLLTLAVTAIVAAPHAQAQGIAVLFVPPFTEQVTTLSALQIPCVIGDPGVPATESDPSAGEFAPLAAGITVSNCTLHGRTELRRWALGDVLLPLVGQPAQVIAIFDGLARATASGNGTELAAALELRLGDDDVDGDWQTIVRARCVGDGCSGQTRGGPLVFAQDLDALPATLYATFRSATHAEAATGHAEATFTGGLRYVIIRPLD